MGQSQSGLSTLLRPHSPAVVAVSAAAVGAIGYGVFRLYFPAKTPLTEDPSAVVSKPAGEGVITGVIPSRLIPLAGLGSWIITFGGSLAMSIYFGHDRNGLIIPYISDCAKESPERAYFSYGSTIASVLIGSICVLNYGKVLHDMRKHPEGCRCRKRNLVATICGAIGAPFLGLLACFDTKDNPKMHMAMVLIFFPMILVFMYTSLSVYQQMLVLRSAKPNKTPADVVELDTLRRSLFWKRLLATINSVSVSLYLPVGMSLVSDWYDYRNDFAIHQARAVTQHISVICVVCYFASFYYDFTEFYNNFVTYSAPRGGGHSDDETVAAPAATPKLLK